MRSIYTGVAVRFSVTPPTPWPPTTLVVFASPKTPGTGPEKFLKQLVTRWVLVRLPHFHTSRDWFNYPQSQAPVANPLTHPWASSMGIGAQEESEHLTGASSGQLSGVPQY